MTFCVMQVAFGMTNKLKFWQKPHNKMFNTCVRVLTYEVFLKQVEPHRKLCSGQIVSEFRRTIINLLIRVFRIGRMLYFFYLFVYEKEKDVKEYF